MNFELSAKPMLNYKLRIISCADVELRVTNYKLRIVGCPDYESYNRELSLLAEGMFIAQLIPNYIIPNRRSRQLKIRNLLYEI